MSRPRFSIAGLMGLVLVVAVGVAALRSGSEDWAGIVLTLTLGILGVALLGMIFRQGSRRAFWSGFALFGWGYLTLTMAPWFNGEVGPRLATTRGLDLLFTRLHPGAVGTFTVLTVNGQTSANGQTQFFLPWQNALTSTATTNGTTTGTTWTTAGLTPTSFWMTAAQPSPEPFRRIGHALFALLAAWIGGRIARYFAEDRGAVAA